jgi:hypothetical protein
MAQWRNWQTRRSQKAVPQGLRVRVPFEPQKKIKRRDGRAAYCVSLEN